MISYQSTTDGGAFFRKHLALFLATSLTLSFLAPPTLAAIDGTLKSFNDLAATVRDLTLQSTPSETLVIFDFDDTLLTTEGILGSEAWFNWQAQILKDAPNSTLLVSKNFSGLLKAQNTILAVAAHKPVEPSLKDDIESLQKDKYFTMVMTSRGPEERSLTQRELKRNGIDFSTQAPRLRLRQTCEVLPYDLEKTEAIGISQDLKAKLKMKVAKKICYENGLFFTEGQHRGVMLKFFTTHIARAVKNIIFINNFSKPLEDLKAAFENSSDLKIITLRYAGRDSFVSLSDTQKSEASAAWSDFRNLIQKLFPTTLDDIEKGRFIF
jgi:hypothetical protein